MDERIPRIGVAVIMQRGDTVLVGQRRSTTHGDGTWQFPGGHLEFGETVEQCAIREAAEETGLDVTVTGRGPWVDSFFVAEGRQYVTLFVLTTAEKGEAELREPDKCVSWCWCRWDELPEPLFIPILELKSLGWRPPGQ